MFNKKNENHIIDVYRKKANEIESSNTYNYNYKYWIATPNGMLLDDLRNHEYGSTRAGYEQWKVKEPQTWYAEFSGKISLRPIIDRVDNSIVGYITEEKQTDYLWYQEIKQIVSDCFDTLCTELDVIDIENFKYFIFSDLGLFKDLKMELKTRLDIMVEVYDNYIIDSDYKKLIDKIKS